QSRFFYAIPSRRSNRREFERRVEALRSSEPERPNHTEFLRTTVRNIFHAPVLLPNIEPVRLYRCRRRTMALAIQATNSESLTASSIALDPDLLKRKFQQTEYSCSQASFG